MLLFSMSENLYSLGIIVWATKNNYTHKGSRLKAVLPSKVDVTEGFIEVTGVGITSVTPSNMMSQGLRLLQPLSASPQI